VSKAKEVSDDALKKLVLRQQRAIAAGKRGYKLSDQITDELAEHMKAGRVVDLGGGRVAKLKDKFADANRVGYGGAVRRFEVEVTEAADVKL
jgi:hypothetical protein